jgi:hypothetical protein
MSSRTLAAIAALLVVAPLVAQTPTPEWKGENLQHFPKDMSRERLTQRMREFSFALNVRCQYCHAGGDGVSFQGVSFASDEKPAKVKARHMLRMVDQLNATILPQLPARAEPRVEVDCATCHHGLALPKSLQTTLLEVIEKDGIAAAVERYRSLRQDTMTFGRYDFGQWEMNELARRLSEAGRADAAIAMLELNGEFYPKSAEIDFQLAELHRGRGERDKALARYRAVLVKSPDNRFARQRIDELEKKD